MEDKKILWCAAGDSFTYLNDHLDETAYRVTEGYLTRTCGKVEGLVCRNMGINGSTTRDWLAKEFEPADLYTLLLGTNDWHQGIPLGGEEDFESKREGSILGNLGRILENMKKASPHAPIIVMNPVERGEFVYILDHSNHAPASDEPDHGQTLSHIAEEIIRVCVKNHIPCLDLHKLSGFSQETVVNFKRVRTENGYQNLSYPAYKAYLYDWERDEYPYPKEAAALTYDGLHPTDLGNERIASLLAGKIREVLYGTAFTV